MKLSVIICTRNRAASLLPSLHSVAQAIIKAAPQLPPRQAEIVVVDNASTDDTAAVIRAFAASVAIPVRTPHEAKPGLSAARNCGIRESRGALIVFIDDDCRMDENYILDALRYDALDTAPVLRGGKITLGDPSDLPLTTKTRPLPARWSQQDRSARHENLGDTILGCNMTMRRALVEQIGLYDERLGAGMAIPAGEDTDYVFRTYLAGLTIQYVPDMAVAHFHGRKSAAEGNRLMRGYMIGMGALYAKYLFKDFNLIRPFIWDFKDMLRDLRAGTNRYFPAIDFSFADKVKYSLIGGLKYLYGAARG